MATPEEIKAIAGLYVAYFDRAPDPAGLEFWINQLDNGRDFATISQDFADSPEAKQIYPFLATPEVSGLDPTNLVTSIYQNLFGRDPEAQGLNFWVDVVNSGAVAVGDMVEAIMLGARDAVVDGELVLDKTTVENRIDCALEYSTATSLLPGFEFDTEAYNIARAVVDSVDATQESVDAAKLVLAEYIAGEGTQSGATFTLCEHVIEVSPEVVTEQLVTETVIYWGFNPHSNGEEGVDNTAEPNTNNLTNEGPSDGGIPAAAFFGAADEDGDFVGGYFQSIAEQHFAEIGDGDGSGIDDGIDVDDDTFSTVDFTSLRDVTLTNGDASNGTVTFHYSDGSSDDISIGNAYIDLLRDLIFDEEGNSRFFEKEVASQVPVYMNADGEVQLGLTGAVDLDPTTDVVDPIGYVDAVLTTVEDAVYATIPPILTPSVNNGGTFEPGFPDQDGQIDNLFVAGQLELLHGAIIDGGAGYNTLEIDAKGVFAQPKSLVNIQHISIQNLPNIYTVGEDDQPENGSVFDGNDYPNLPEDSAYEQDSIIDISRARDLETLTVTQGDFEDLGNLGEDTQPGDLTVTGIRNGATVTVDGFFDSEADVRLNYSDASVDGVNVVFNNLNMQSDLEVAHNSPKITIDSDGGSNYLASGNLSGGDGGHLREMVITGDAHLHIEGDMAATFTNNPAVSIDASANTGGVTLALTGSEDVTFYGTNTDDIFRVATPEYIGFAVNTGSATPVYVPGGIPNDSIVTINSGDGDDRVEVITYTLNANMGSGDNNLEATALDITATAGDGDNHFEIAGVYGSIVAGDGDNQVDLALFDAVNSLWNDRDDAPTNVSVTLGDGDNKFTFGTPVLGGANATIPSLVGFQTDQTGLEFTTSGFSVADDIDSSVTYVGGDGGNQVVGTASYIDVTTGGGNDYIDVSGVSVKIASNGGDDEITITGFDDDYVTQVAHLENGGTPATLNVLTFTPNEFDGTITGGAPGEDDAGVEEIQVFYTVDGEFRSVIIGDDDFDPTSLTSIGEAVEDALDDDTDLDVSFDSTTGLLTVAGNSFFNPTIQTNVDHNVVIQGVNVLGDNINGLDVSFASSSSSNGYGDGFADDGSFNYKGFVPSVYGVELDIDTGAGSATINLGRSDEDNLDNAGPGSRGIVAKEGSSITGNDITLVVDTHADLRAASLDGITSIIFDDDNVDGAGQGFGVGTTSTDQASSLTLLDTQVAALMADGVSMSVEGQTFGAQSVLTIVVTSSTSLSDLIDLSSWNENIKLCFVIEDGVTLTLTAEQLHTYVAPEGIAVDEENGYNDNQVVVTNAGFDFDPFNDQYGGTGAGTISGSLSNEDITIVYTADGFTRPQEDTSTATIEINSDDTPVVDIIESRFAKDLEISGSADFEITGYVDLAEDFTIDFSALTGDFPENADGVEVAMTIYNFQEITGDVNDPVGSLLVNNGSDEGYIDPYSWGRIDGNGTSADPVRINVVMQDGSSAGDCDQGPAKGGINSSGVQQYVLTNFIDENGYLVPQSVGGDATIVVCDHTEDLEVLGLQNNRNGQVTFHQVNWGTDILMEGDGYANASDQEKNLGDPDYSEVGKVVANFFEPGANATVRVTNQGTELGLNEDAEDGFDPDGERKLDVAGIVLNNADRLLLNVEDGDAKINDVTGHDLERIIVTGPEDVEIVVNGISERESNDGSKDDYESMMDGLNSDNLVSIDGSAVVGVFTLTLTAPSDLSGVSLAGIDAICLDFGDNGDLTMTADQVVAYGALLDSKDGIVTLNVVDMADQSIDMASLVSDKLIIGDVTFVDETVTVDAGTNFGGAQTLIIPEDGQITMTVAQFESADNGDGSAPTVTDSDGVDANTSPTPTPANVNDDDNKLILTEVPAGVAGSSEVDLANVSTDVDVDVLFVDYIANSNFDVSATGGETTTAVIGGTTDLSAGMLGTVDCIVLQDGAVLTLSEAQISTLLASYAASPAGMADPVVELSDVIKLADGASATLNINQIDGTSATALDLTELVDDLGGNLDIGVLTLMDFNDGTPITLNDGVNDWTMGGADEIVTPTGSLLSPEFGVESTILNLTMSQFLDLDGIGFISGDSVVNITGLANTIDGPDAGTDPDQAGTGDDADSVDIDTSGITARKGIISLVEVGANPTVNGEAVYLTDTADISGFSISLTDGQLIGFATEAQASGATIIDNALPAVPPAITPNPVGVVWTFNTWSGNAIDTSGYDAGIDTLFVRDEFVDGQNEEAIWTTLASSIVVQKYNDVIPAGLAVINRINTFEPFTTAPNGITFDDQDGLQTTGILTLNLEGNVVIGDVTVADTVGDGAFQAIRITSTFDEENNPADANANGNPFDDGVVIQPNTVGDIFLNAPVAANTILEVFMNTSNGQADPSFANGGTGAGSGTDFDIGQDLVTGTIHLGAPAANVNAAVVDVTNTIGTIASGGNITIGGLDYSNAFLTRVDVQTDFFDFAQDFTIGTLNIGDLSTAMNLTGDPDKYVILNNFTATTLTDLNDLISSGTVVAGPTEIIMATDGNVDLKAMPATTAQFDVDGVYALSAGTIDITGAQLQAILASDTTANGIAENFVLAPGVAPGSVTINICELNGVAVDLDSIAAAGFNIGKITMTEDTVLAPGTTLGGADEIVLELGNSADTTIALEMTAAQFNGFSGIISETTVASPVNPTATYQGQVIVDELEGIETGTTLLTVDIDLGQVTTTGANTTMLSSNVGTTIVAGAATPVAGEAPLTGLDGDVILTDTSVLGNFVVRLNDVTGTVTANELAGHTIRFATTEQADGRAIIVDGPEGTDAEQDTNVVWLFTTLGVDGDPGLDVSGYDENLGRIWVYDDLVETMVGNNIELLFTIDDPDNPGTPLFTLEEGIIKRIESGDLTDALAVAQPFVQTIEIVSGTGLAGLMAEITDPIVFLEQLTIDLGGLTNNGDLEIDNLIGIDVLGDDDFALLTLNSFIGDFYVSDDNKHYLLPDDFSMPPGALPSDALQFANPANVFGDILAGGDRGVLRDIVINTGVGEYVINVTSPEAAPGAAPVATIAWTLNGVAQTPLAVALTDATDVLAIADDIANAINALPASNGIVAQANGASVVVNDNGSDVFAVTGITPNADAGAVAAAGADVVGERGTAFEAQTIFFSEDSDPEVGLGGAAGVGTLDVNGVHDVTVKAVDFTDAEMIVANVDTTGHTGTFTATGGSAAFTGGATTEKLIIANGGSTTGTVLFGGQNGDDPSTAFTQETDFFSVTEVGGQVQAGIDGEALSKIDTSGHSGTVNLGIVSRIDGTGMTADTTAGFNPAETFNGGFNDGFILDNSGAGTVILCLGAAENTDDTITFPVLEAGGEWTFTGPGIELEMKQVTLEGTLNLTGVDLCITGDIDFSDLEALNIDITSTIEVKAGGSLTLTVEQVDALQDIAGGPIVIFGEGEVIVEGVSDSGSTDAETDFANLQTAIVNLSAVTLDPGDDGALQITASGAKDENGDPLTNANGDRVAQTIIGTDANEEVTIAAGAGDMGMGSADTIDVILQLGGDDGDIGTPQNTPDDDFPVGSTPDDDEEVGDTIDKSGASGVQIQVDATEGFDAVDGLETGDVVKVSADAQFYGLINGEFVADDRSENNAGAFTALGDGAAVLQTNDEDEVSNTEAALGTTGFFHVGGTDNNGADMENDHVGGDVAESFYDGQAGSDGDNADEVDSFTLNGEADTVFFNFIESEVGTATAATVVEGRDYEEITVGAIQGGDTLEFVFAIAANTSVSILVDDPGTTTDDLASALSAALVNSGMNSSVTGSVVTAFAPDGDRFDLVDVFRDPDGANTDVGADFADEELDDIGDYEDDPNDAGDTDIPNDNRTELLVTFDGAPGDAVGDGDVYEITVQTSTGSEYTGVYVAQAGDTLQDVIDELADDLNTKGAGNQYFSASGNGPSSTGNGEALPFADPTQTAVVADLQILAWDDDAKDGGFNFVEDGSGNIIQAVPTIIGLSSSSILETTDTTSGEGADGADGDNILDFVTGTDKIDFLDLAAGADGVNYGEGTGTDTTSFADAYLEARTEMAANNLTYFFNISDEGGHLFYDANADASNEPDGLVNFTGFTSLDDFAATDII